jgi:hypothetical protein
LRIHFHRDLLENVFHNQGQPVRYSLANRRCKLRFQYQLYPE